MKRYINKQGHFFDYDDTFAVTDTELILMTDEEIAELNKPTEAQLQEQANAEAREYLQSTDWYVSRFTETGKEIPEEVKTKRDEARLQIK